MNTITTLKRPQQIAIGGFIAALLLIVVYMVFMRGGGETEVYRSSSAREIEAAQWKLKQHGITPVLRSDLSDAKVLDVPSAQADDARVALDNTSVGGQLNSKVKNSCPKPSAFGGTRGYDDYDKCLAKHKVESFLGKVPGILQANAEVNVKKNDSLTGNEEITTVSIYLFKKELTTNVNARGIAMTVSGMAGADSKDVQIFDADSNELLWGDNVSSSTGAMSGGSACMMPEEGSVDIARKEEYISCSYEQKLTRKIEDLVGDDRAKVSASVTLNPEAKSVTAEEIRQGALTAQTLDPEGMKESSWRNGSRTSNVSSNAGYIKDLRLAVTLDSQYVDPSMQGAVFKMLKAYVDADRGDPIPTVSRVKFSKEIAGAPIEQPAGAGDAPASGTGAGSGNASDGSAGEVAGVQIREEQSIPGVAIALVAVLLIGLAAVIAVLWRRSARLAAERQRLAAGVEQQEFALQSFAKESPDEMARALESILGTPARQNPTYQ